ncbi:MAG: hypothetical protein Q8O72_10640 [Bacteroidales bacterium]|nr:hypothetical protein [Bacteroidales bacterium]
MKKVPYDQNTLTDLTVELIEEFKKQYKGVFQITVEDKKCFLHTPDRHILDAASAGSKKADSKFNEILMKGSWLAGDKELVEDDDYFFAAGKQLTELINTKEAQLKKL